MVNGEFDMRVDNAVGGFVRMPPNLRWRDGEIACLEKPTAALCGANKKKKALFQASGKHVPAIKMPHPPAEKVFPPVSLATKLIEGQRVHQGG